MVTIKNFVLSTVFSGTPDKDSCMAKACLTNQFESVSKKIHHVTPAVLNSTNKATSGPATYHHIVALLNPIIFRASLDEISHGRGQMTIIETGINRGLLNPPKRMDACSIKIIQTTIHDCGNSR